MSAPLSGRVALVTGAGANIGRAIALRLAELGADVCVNVRSDAQRGEAVAEQVRSLGRRALCVPADVADFAAVEAMFARVSDELGPVTVLVNNAAIRPRTPFLEMTPQLWREVLAVGLDGAFHCARMAVPMMVAAGWGRVVNISGVDGFAGIANRAHGATVKAGLHGFTKALAREFADRGITANTVVPGPIDTPKRSDWYPGWNRAEATGRVPVGRLGSVEEIADAVAAAVQNGFMTGAALHVNGGQWMG